MPFKMLKGKAYFYYCKIIAAEVLFPYQIILTFLS